MKNKEKYIDEICEAMSGAYTEFCNFKEIRILKNGDCNKMPGMVNCEECRKITKEWLEQEYQEPLKPCPFCGGEAKVESDEDSDYYWIICKKCRANTNNYMLREDAIDAWNRRA